MTNIRQGNLNIIYLNTIYFNYILIICRYFQMYFINKKTYTNKSYEARAERGLLTKQGNAIMPH